MERLFKQPPPPPWLESEKLGKKKLGTTVALARSDYSRQINFGRLTESDARRRGKSPKKKKKKIYKKKKQTATASRNPEPHNQHNVLRKLWQHSPENRKTEKIIGKWKHSSTKRKTKIINVKHSKLVGKKKQQLGNHSVRWKLGYPPSKDSIETRSTESNQLK